MLSDGPLSHADHGTLGVPALNGRRDHGNVVALSPSNSVREHRCCQRVTRTGQNFESLAICRSISRTNSCCGGQ